MTVVCNVSDLKVPHVNRFGIAKFGEYLSIIYGGLTVYMEKVYDYFGMDLKYHKQGTVKAYMIKWLGSVLQEFPENLGATVATPAANHLFKVYNESKKQYLTEEKAHIFHQTVPKLLSMSARARQYIHIEVVFITTHVKKPDKYYWVKIKSVLKYIKGTRNLNLNFIIDDMSMVKLWVFTSYTIQEDC